MKAYVLHNINELRYEDAPMPECPEGWAIVKVKAAGICSSDIPRIFTKGTYHFPTIPGHEFSGVVAATGSPSDSRWTGRRVGVFPLIPCRHCAACAEKHYEMCEHYDYIGSRRDGGFAEYAAVPVWNLVALPDSIAFEHAAMLEPLSVALHAVKKGRIRQGEHVAVVGTGMIGIAAAQWAKMAGAGSVAVIARNENKRKIVEDCGVDYLPATDGKAPGQYDFVLEAVGTPQSISLAIESVRPGGRLVLMGNPSGNIALTQNIYWRILRKQLSLTGTWNSSYDGKNPSDWTEAVEALANNSVRVESLITHVFGQEDLTDGLLMMRRHETPYCKVMTLWNQKN